MATKNNSTKQAQAQGQVKEFIGKGILTLSNLSTPAQVRKSLEKLKVDEPTIGFIMDTILPERDENCLNDSQATKKNFGEKVSAITALNRSSNALRAFLRALVYGQQNEKLNTAAADAERVELEAKIAKKQNSASALIEVLSPRILSRVYRQNNGLGEKGRVPTTHADELNAFVEKHLETIKAKVLKTVNAMSADLDAEKVESVLNDAVKNLVKKTEEPKQGQKHGSKSHESHESHESEGQPVAAAANA
jgi:hypothetical protein